MDGPVLSKFTLGGKLTFKLSALSATLPLVVILGEATILVALTRPVGHENRAAVLL